MKNSLRFSFFAVIVVIVITVIFAGCTDNSRARRFGGTEEVTLDTGQKFVNVTWKDTDLWVLTRPARPGETSETYTLHEKSSMGVMEGTILIIEQIVAPVPDTTSTPTPATYDGIAP